MGMWWLNGDVVDHWGCGGSIWGCGGSIGSAPDFWGRGLGLESGVSHNDPGSLQDHSVVCKTVLKNSGYVDGQTLHLKHTKTTTNEKMN